MRVAIILLVLLLCGCAVKPSAKREVLRETYAYIDSCVAVGAMTKEQGYEHLQNLHLASDAVMAGDSK